MAFAYCARCDFRIEKGQALHSKHTNSYYCANMEDCTRRARNDLTLTEINQLANQTLARLKGNK